jgi:undecaprenyl-diphosphatase
VSREAVLAAWALGAVVVVLLLRRAAWWVASLLARAGAMLPGLPRSRAWARTHPMRAWLIAKAPRSYALIAARLRPTAFTGLPLTLMVLAALYVAGLLGGLVDAVVDARGVVGSDLAVNQGLAAWREPWMIGAFLWITTLGAGAALAAVAVTATGFLWADRRPGLILPLWLVFLGAVGTTWAGKYAIDRARPVFLADITALSPSFPSGHATGAMAVYGFLAYALVRDLPGRRQRFEVCYWAAVLIGAIGFSRIYLSVHFVTDVAAGFLVGAFWLLVGVALAEWTRARAK